MDFESAGFHFSQLLIAKPTYWTALARLIEVMRRNGTLSEALPFLQRAEDATARNFNEPGILIAMAQISRLSRFITHHNIHP